MPCVRERETNKSTSKELYLFWEGLYKEYNTSLFFLAVLSLRCCVQAFSSCGERGLLSSYGAWISHCGGFFCCRSRSLARFSRRGIPA